MGFVVAIDTKSIRKRVYATEDYLTSKSLVPFFLGKSSDTVYSVNNAPGIATSFEPLPLPVAMASNPRIRTTCGPPRMPVPSSLRVLYLPFSILQVPGPPEFPFVVSGSKIRYPDGIGAPL